MRRAKCGKENERIYGLISAMILVLHSKARIDNSMLGFCIARWAETIESNLLTFFTDIALYNWILPNNSYR